MTVQFNANLKEAEKAIKILLISTTHSLMFYLRQLYDCNLEIHMGNHNKRYIHGWNEGISASCVLNLFLFDNADRYT